MNDIRNMGQENGKPSTLFYKIIRLFLFHSDDFCSDEWNGLNAVFYKILNFMLVHFNWVLLEWFTSVSSLYLTSADLGRVEAKSLKYKSKPLPKIFFLLETTY